ncbi:MAG: YkgJ family cysteine cluster protein [Thermodesulfovibrio sp.]|jgi:Fe-S-cluster containining protein|uniref:Zinc/iron-chelating domain-containing protein n=2 Tax=Thermodesulfovibrio TaxID=28261 RepID=A0A2J6WID7_9BACT|nr:MAG: zinc/iron-chelating domain-containing protein [Thermodesulfovibrio aggregans]
MLNINAIAPEELTEESKFKFRCYPGISCYKSCCKNIDIMLTPFDIMRLKNRFGISSGEFLMKYTYVFIEPKSGYPFVFLNKNDDEEKTCPFLCEAGCSVYEDRPATCRYYPIGQVSLKKFDFTDGITEEHYFFVKEPHCKGFNEDREWTVAEWRKDQGVDLYDDMNRGWKELFFKRNLKPERLDERKAKAFYMACYDIDAFRRFVFESRFLQVFDVSEERVEKMKKDETELMNFGFDYVKFLLMIKETMKLKHS